MKIDGIGRGSDSWSIKLFYYVQGFKLLCKTEGIIPALEPSHAIYETVEIAKRLPKDKIVLCTVSGRGDKDMITVAKSLGVHLTM